MAKGKKKEDKEEKDDGKKLSIVESVLKGIQKTYGNVVRSGDEIKQQDVVLVSISPKVDEMIKGGVPEGTVATLSGKEGSGKTTTALTLAANAQKMGKVVYYISIEGRLSKKDLDGIEGLDTDPKKFVIIESTEERMLTGNEMLDITMSIINQHKGCLIIIDSMSALCDEQESAGGINYQGRGSGAKVTSTFSRQTAQSVRVNKIIVIMIVHLTLKQGQVSYLDEKIADTTKYLTSLQLKIKKTEKWEDGDDQIGQILNWEVKKNSLGPPGRTTTSYLKYGIGIDKVAELCSLGEDYGLIEKGGSWYTVDFLEDKPKFQGENKLHAFFRENPQHVDKLEAEIKGLS